MTLKKGSFHARLWAKLLAFNRSRGLLRPGDRVLAAVSGGPDSVCLAHALGRLAPRLRLGLRLIHFHHGLRGRAADQDARLVKRLGARLGAPTVVRRLAVARYARASRRGLEDAGRILRYRALALEARLSGCRKVATAHHSDDQAETVLLHLLRGTTAKGLAGIPARRGLVRGVDVVRPLLCFTRAEVMQYIRYNNLPYRTDRMNRDIRFMRAWVRWKVLPLLRSRSPRIAEHLCAIAGEVARAPRRRRGRAPGGR